MNLLQEPTYILAILLLLIVIADWLSRRPYFRHIGPALLVILFGMLLANLGVIPTSTNATAVYTGVFAYAAPLGIFFLLLDVKLKDLKLAGPPMLIMFFIGSAATIIGVITSYYIFSPQQHGVAKAYAVAGMYTGTYIGGSINLNAIALNYGVNKDGNLFAAVNAVDNIVGTIWMMMTFLIPPFLQKWFPRKRKIPKEMEGLTDEQIREKIMQPARAVSIEGISLLIFLGLGTMVLAAIAEHYLPQVPSILVLTTIALVLAQLPFVHKIEGTRLLGFILIMIFLAVVGAYCDLRVLFGKGGIALLLLEWVTVMILVHAFIILLTGGLMKQDWDIVAVASNANIGGAASAPVCANSLGRPDLQLPGLLAGSVGNAIGTYLGILVAEFLK